jgi:chromosome partitioning protein
MKTIAVAMQKGGSGKTTTTVNLAAALGELYQRVLVVDCDPQGNASTWLGVTDPSKGLFSVLCESGTIKSILHDSGRKGVAIAPSSPWLTGAERVLATEVGAETILRRQLKYVANDFDLCLIDTPPTLGVLTVGALAAADKVLIPCEAHVLALNGLAQLMRTIEAVQERLSDNLELLGIVACRVDARTRHATEVVEELRKQFPEETLQTVIRESVRLAEAPSFAEPITVYDPKGAGAEDYRALAREVLQRLQTL